MPQSRRPPLAAGRAHQQHLAGPGVQVVSPPKQRDRLGGQGAGVQACHHRQVGIAFCVRYATGVTFSGVKLQMRRTASQQQYVRLLRKHDACSVLVVSRIFCVAVRSCRCYEQHFLCSNKQNSIAPEIKERNEFLTEFHCLLVHERFHLHFSVRKSHRAVVLSELPLQFELVSDQRTLYAIG